MRIAAIVCNAVLLPFTLLVLVTDGPPTALPYVVLAVLLLGVPTLTLLVLGRRDRREGARNAVVLANVALLALACWAVADQYPHPPDPGVVPFTILVLVTPVLSAWAAWRARERPLAS